MMMIGARTAAWAKSGAPLPYLRKLAYLERNSLQWIDADFLASSTTSCKVECEFPIQGKIGAFVGFGFFGNGDSRFQVAIQNDSIILVAIGVNATIGWIEGFHNYELDIKNLTAKIDGETIVGSFSRPTDYLGFYLFRSNRRDGSQPESKIRIRRCELFDNGTMIRALIPVMSLENEPCMYDEATGRGGMNHNGTPRDDGLYFNQGTGTFGYADL